MPSVAIFPKWRVAFSHFTWLSVRLLVFGVVAGVTPAMYEVMSCYLTGTRCNLQWQHWFPYALGDRRSQEPLSGRVGHFLSIAMHTMAYIFAMTVKNVLKSDKSSATLDGSPADSRTAGTSSVGTGASSVPGSVLVPHDDIEDSVYSRSVAQQVEVADICAQSALVGLLTNITLGLGLAPPVPSARSYLYFYPSCALHGIHSLVAQACIVHIAAQQVEDASYLGLSPTSQGSSSSSGGSSSSRGFERVGLQRGSAGHEGKGHAAGDSATFGFKDFIVPAFGFTMVCFTMALPVSSGGPLAFAVSVIMGCVLCTDRHKFFNAILQWEQREYGTAMSMRGALFKKTERTFLALILLMLLFQCAYASLPESLSHWTPVVHSLYVAIWALDNCSLMVVVLVNRALAMEERRAYANRYEMERARVGMHEDMQQKRNTFLRYVFHEARVPLHSTVMALEAMEDELQEVDRLDAGQATAENGGMAPVSAPAPLAAFGLPSSVQPQTQTQSLAVPAPADKGQPRAELGPVKEMLDLAQISTRNVVSIINSVLTLSAIEADAFKVCLQPSSIPCLVTTVVAQMKPHAGRIGSTLEIYVEPGVPSCQLLFDPVRLGQVVSNLVSNALKFVPQNGSGRVQVTAAYLGQHQPAASPVTHRIRIQVTDNGIGIPESDQPKLFQPYEQVHSGGAQAGAGQGKREQGTGLGLSIAKEVVHKHGGSIGVISTPGKGSTFWFELDLQAATQESQVAVPDIVAGTVDHAGSAVSGDASVRPSSAMAAGDCSAERSSAVSTTLVSSPQSGPAHGPLRVLVVDDSDSNRRLMCRLLQRRIKGCVVWEASNGLHALEQVLGLDSSEGQADKVACYGLADASCAQSGPVAGPGVSAAALPCTCAPVTAPTTHKRPLEQVDLIFMDGSMPVMDGYQATARIRAVGFKGRIIGVTGNALAEDQVRFLHAGAELVLVKPVTGEQIVQQCTLVEGNL